MKFLLKGFGSIGKRHCANLLNLGYQDIVIVSSQLELGADFGTLRVYQTLEAALDEHQFSHGLICSPTSFHFEDLRVLLKACVPNIFLEKPVGNSLEGLEELTPFLSGKSMIVVGFDLHFDPGLWKVKSLLTEGSFGNIYSANAFVGQYLPDWRPYEDHRLGVSASVSKGGGVLLDLVHEFDYLNWLLGKPSLVSAFYQKNPKLEIETEDLADVLIRFESGATATVHLDYHQRKLIRFCIFTCEYGTIKWDLAERKVEIVHDGLEAIEYNYNHFERNERYIQLIQSFIENPEDPRLTNFEEGLISFKVVLAAKLSNDTKRMIPISDL